MPVALSLMRKRTSILRSAGLLIIATVALVFFIALTGDSRRQSNAMHRAHAYAAELTTRMGDGRLLPLNLSPPKPSSSDQERVGMEWLSSADAYLLRRGGHAVLAAWTIPIVRALGADGRAAIFFDNGAFSVRRLTSGEFARYKADQAKVLDKLREGATHSDG